LLFPPRRSFWLALFPFVVQQSSTNGDERKSSLSLKLWHSGKVLKTPVIVVFQQAEPQHLNTRTFKSAASVLVFATHRCCQSARHKGRESYAACFPCYLAVLVSVQLPILKLAQRAATLALRVGGGFGPCLLPTLLHSLNFAFFVPLPASVASLTLSRPSTGWYLAPLGPQQVTWTRPRAFRLLAVNGPSGCWPSTSTCLRWLSILSPNPFCCWCKVFHRLPLRGGRYSQRVFEVKGSQQAGCLL